jgi:SAM-dependent methyltransferase
MRKLISRLYHNKIISRAVHTLNYCLQRELGGCRTVLDLGCGPSSPLQHCHWIKYSVGVEAFRPYLEESRRAKIHTKYLNKKIEEVDFPDNSFDAVIMIDVLEHLSRKTALNVLKKAEKWAKKKVIVNTPNGFVGQPVIDENPYQRHRSGWTCQEMKKLGFRCYGLAGLKFLRKEKDPGADMGDDLTISIRFEPKSFWFAIAVLSQILTHNFPTLAFELFCIKILDNSGK